MIWSLLEVDLESTLDQISFLKNAKKWNFETWLLKKDHPTLNTRGGLILFVSFFIVFEESKVWELSRSLGKWNKLGMGDNKKHLKSRYQLDHITDVCLSNVTTKKIYYNLYLSSLNYEEWLKDRGISWNGL